MKKPLLQLSLGKDPDTPSDESAPLFTFNGSGSNQIFLGHELSTLVSGELRRSGFMAELGSWLDFGTLTTSNIVDYGI